MIKARSGHLFVKFNTIVHFNTKVGDQWFHVRLQGIQSERRGVTGSVGSKQPEFSVTFNLNSKV